MYSQSVARAGARRKRGSGQDDLAELSRRGLIGIRAELEAIALSQCSARCASKGIPDRLAPRAGKKAVE